ncbi:MAG TPA: nuclear transport factor 2 family protein [Nitrososphaera sp.]|nr:nuclear transport factor 2 family protein [Nitrososphaera sp.]
MQKNETAKSAKEIVTEFMQAMERKEWKTVRSHISDNISVLAPGPAKLITFHQAEAYMYYLEHATGPPPEIKKVIADGNDVCVTFEITYPDQPQQVTTLVCGLFHLNDDGKIGVIRLVLDPRELFQKLGY